MRERYLSCVLLEQLGFNCGSCSVCGMILVLFGLLMFLPDTDRGLMPKNNFSWVHSKRLNNWQKLLRFARRQSLRILIAQYAGGRLAQPPNIICLIVTGLWSAKLEGWNSGGHKPKVLTSVAIEESSSLIILLSSQPLNSHSHLQLKSPFFDSCMALPFHAESETTQI